MAIQRYTITGNGQVEINNCAFRRDGRIEAQCAADAAMENGMIVKVDSVARKVSLPGSAIASGELLGLNYSAEHQYDERKMTLKDFAIAEGEYPRIGYLAVGDKFTTNAFCYDTSAYADDAAVKAALAAGKLFGSVDATGAICLAASAPSSPLGGLVFAAEKATMPDGQFAVKFQVIAD